VLDNGLEVIAEEARVSPLVAVSVLYRVGSRNETTGKTGVSHFVEHMLFNGTEKYPGDTATKKILKNGGIPNGETYWDYTHFGGVLPSDKIDEILDIEADRMANATVDSQGVEDERDIILEELAMRGEAPIMVLLEDLFASAFKIHPYHHWYPGGYFTDVDHMDAAYVREFYEMYYHPANTVISVVGNIDEDEAIEKVRGHFEGIEAGPPPLQAYQEEPRQQGLRRITVRGDAAEGRIMMFFRGPEFASRDYEIGSVMSFILANGRSSILNKKVVETGIATEIALVLIPTIDPFGFLLMASVEEGGDLQACEKAIYDAIEDFKTAVPDEETLKRAISRVQGLTILGTQTPRARAFELATAAARGDWAYVDDYPDNIMSITPDDISWVAQKYLDWNQATIGWLIPRSSDLENEDLIGMSGGPPQVCGVVSCGVGLSGTGLAGIAGLPHTLPVCRIDDLGAGGSGTGGMAMTFEDALYEELPNGVTLILKEDHTLPVVAVRAGTMAGAAFEPEGKSGLARLTAKTVAMGSADYPYDHLYERVEALGSDISASSDLERAFIGIAVLSTHWEEAGRMVSDLVASPALRSRDLKRARRELLSDISQIEEDAKNVGLIKFREYYYGDHPYSRRKAGTREVVRGLSLRDVKAFYDETWTPESTVITAVGDFETAEMRQLLTSYLAGWDNQRKSAPDISVPEPVSGFSRYIETLPEKRQVKIFWGMKGPGMRDPDFEAFQVMNFIFGGQVFGSRLFDRIREDEALAYVVHTDIDLTRQPGAMYVHLGTRPRNVEKATDAVREEIERMLSADVTDEEMDLTKSFMKSLLPFMMQTYYQIAAQLGDLVFYDLPRDYYDTRAERIDGVSRQDVHEAARKYLDPDNSCMVIVGAVDDNLKPVRPTGETSYGR
jgi:zinc protease